jgi:hypothetical protein
MVLGFDWCKQMIGIRRPATPSSATSRLATNAVQIIQKPRQSQNKRDDLRRPLVYTHHLVSTHRLVYKHSLVYIHHLVYTHYLVYTHHLVLTIHLVYTVYTTTYRY